MLLENIIKDIEVLHIEGPLHKEIDAIYYDSRQVTPRSLFFCIEGYTLDGHNYAVSAVEQGACAVVLSKDVPLPEGVCKIFVSDTREAMGLMASRFFGDPTKGLLLIGVTGTNGKTTSTYLVKSILEQYGKKVGLIGTITNMIGDRRIPTDKTTPESLDLQRLFREMVNEGVEAIVMEVSSHSLELKRVAGCIYEAGIFTNLTQDHLDFHGTMENYREAKMKLFKQSHVAIVNVDDENGRIILEKITGKTFTYGIQRPADVFARDLEITARGVSFQLYILGTPISIQLNIPGIFSVYNALSAAAACYSAGMSLQEIKLGLELVRGVPGRFELLDTDTAYSVILDYAHTPDGLENILKTAVGLTKGRVVTLFGCGGNRDPIKRPIMGEIAGRYSNFCIITSDNPRNEEPMAIIEDIIPGIKKTACPYVVIENRREAIAYALENGKKDDVIILAGKGHETYQLIKGKSFHFDEKEIVAELLGKERV